MLLKSVKNLSMLPTALDVFEKAGSIPMLVNVLIHPPSNERLASVSPCCCLGRAPLTVCVHRRHATMPSTRSTIFAGSVLVARKLLWPPVPSPSSRTSQEVGRHSRSSSCRCCATLRTLPHGVSCGDMTRWASTSRCSATRSGSRRLSRRSWPGACGARSCRDDIS